VKNELLNQQQTFGGGTALYATKSGGDSAQKSFENSFGRPSSGKEDDMYAFSTLLFPFLQILDKSLVV
jgi:hypothetical protein